MLRGAKHLQTRFATLLRSTQHDTFEVRLLSDRPGTSVVTYFSTFAASRAFGILCRVTPSSSFSWVLLFMAHASPGWIPNPAEHDAYRRVDLSDERLGQALDRLTRLAVTTLNVPIAMVSVLEGTMQHSRGYIISDEPHPTGVLHTPLSQSLCAYVVQSMEPLIIDDMVHHPGVEAHSG